MRISWLALASMAMCIAQPASAASREFAPNSKWVVNYDADRCTVGREFKSGDDVITLVFSRVEVGDDLSFILIGDLSNFPRSKPVSMQFLPNGDVQQSQVFIGSMKDRKSVVIVQNNVHPIVYEEKNADKFVKTGPVMRIKPEVVAELNGFSIDAGKDRAFTFKTGPLGPVMAELEKCTRSLTEHWGFNPDELDTLSQRAEPIDAAKWMYSNDYPRDLLAFGHMGVVDIRLSVDEQGRPIRCDVNGVMGRSEFSAVTCKKLMQRAKFNPAKDKDGNPTKDLFTERVIFKIR